MDYPPEQRRDDAQLLLARARTLTGTANTIAGKMADDHIDAHYVLEKLDTVERAAAAAARDLRGILERSGADRWVDIGVGKDASQDDAGPSELDKLFPRNDGEP